MQSRGGLLRQLQLGLAPPARSWAGNCIKPRAPDDEMAAGLKALSCRMMLRTGDSVEAPRLGELADSGQNAWGTAGSEIAW